LGLETDTAIVVTKDERQTAQFTGAR